MEKENGNISPIIVGNGSSSTKSVSDLSKPNPNRRWNINKQTLPLKIILFLFSGAMSAVLPYLTIHMKEIGITIEEIAIIYAVLPFSSFLGPPLVGFLADKLGRYKMVLVLVTVANGLFHTLLLTVPIYKEVPVISPLYWKWEEGLGTGFLLPEFNDHGSTNCEQILSSLNHDFPHDEELSDDDNNNLLSLNTFTFLVTPCLSKDQLCSSDSNRTTSFAPFHFHCKDYKFIHDKEDTECLIRIHGSCLRSNALVESNIVYQTNLTFHAGAVEIRGNNAVTFWTYFVLRVIATLFMNSCFSLLDATTLAIIKTEGAEYGKERIFSVLGFGIVSPLAGLLVDYVSRVRGFTDYSAAFYVSNALLILNVITYMVMKLDVEKPDAGVIKNIRGLLAYPEVVVFLVMIFVLGSMWGFVESYLFIFLKELNAPNYLLGLTLTVGSFGGIPFSYGSERILNFFGRVNIMVFAFIAYFLRFFGYSYITSPFWCFPYEAMEAFTYHLMWVAAATYCSELAPKGLLATLTGVMGSLHYGLGKGNGAFVGGYLMAAVGTRLSFRYFGIAAGITGLSYFLVNLIWLKKIVQKRHRETAMHDKENQVEEVSLVTKISSECPDANLIITKDSDNKANKVDVQNEEMLTNDQKCRNLPILTKSKSRK